jgi:hypothetical protein
MGSKKKKQSNPQPKRASAEKKDSPFPLAKIATTLIIGLVAISAALVFKNDDNTNTSQSRPAARKRVIKVFDEAKSAARAAKQEPNSVERAQSASQAFFLEGQMLNASKWTALALRRQALQAGAVPQQAEAVKKYELLHLLQHLEVNVIMLSRFMLQPDGYRYAQQLEQHCYVNNATMNSDVSESLRKDPTALPRSKVAALVVQCMIQDDVLQHLQHGASISMNGWTIWHFLAHFGSLDLVQDALSKLPHKNALHKKDLLGRTPAEIAIARGFEEAARLLVGTAPETAEDGSTKRSMLSTPQPMILIKADVSTIDGGWGSTTAGATRKQHECNIPVAHGHNITMAEFYERYMAKEIPVLVRGGASKSFAELQQLLKKDNLMQAFGRMPVSVGAVPYQATQPTTVYQYLKKFDTSSKREPDYLFESLPPGHLLRMAVQSHYPADWVGESHPDERQVQVAIGPTGSGAPPHYHKAAVNTLFYGKKKWFFIPPKHATYSSKSSMAWIEDYQQSGESSDHDFVLDCVQQPGDVIFVPDFWTHATLNLEPSVAVASEFVSPRMDFDMVL